MPDAEVDWRPEEYQTLAFEDGAELVAFFDKSLNRGDYTLHPWQVEENERLAHAKPTSKHPFKYVLCAANGSGKDLFVIAPFVLWFILTKIQGLVVITSASGVQLTNQTEKYIRNLAILINNHFREQYGQDIIKIRQRHFKCLLSGSEIELYATDEEGRAEGYHPVTPVGEFAIIVNEAKSVAPGIFRALRRCTGYNYFILVSTPGLLPAGDFYNAWLMWPNKRRVTKYDCPHFSDDDFEQDKRELGEHSPLFRSKWLALFTTSDGDTVIPFSAIERLKNKIRASQVFHRCAHWEIRVGIDLAAGGDEVVISAFRGNKQIGMWFWREKDTTLTVDKVDEVLSQKLKLKKDHDFIFADDGGVGRGIIDQLRRHKKWENIHRVLNQSVARKKELYRNRGAELWYNFRRLVEEGIVWLIDDDKLWSQLSTRRYKKEGDGAAIVKVQLESKASAKADGLPSPDRADATVLALCGLTYTSFLDEEMKIEENEKLLHQKRLTESELIAEAENMMFEEAFGDKLRVKSNPHGSLAVIRSYYGNN